jgi:hypothetical protein
LYLILFRVSNLIGPGLFVQSFFGQMFFRGFPAAPPPLIARFHRYHHHEYFVPGRGICPTGEIFS